MVEAKKIWWMGMKKAKEYRLEFICTNIRPALKLLQGKINVYEVIGMTNWKRITTCDFKVEEGSVGWQAKNNETGIPTELTEIVSQFIRSYFRGMILEDNCIVWAYPPKLDIYQATVV
jgi:hypothetical protein